MKPLRGLLVGLGFGALLLSGCSSSDPQDSKAQNDNVATWGDSSTGSDELDILTGGYPDSIIDCGSTMSVNSVLVYNQTDAPQTYSVTVNKQLANELVFYPEVSSAQGVSSGCQDIYSGSASTQTVTVQPGDAVQSAIIAGGGQWNDLDNNHNVAIGQAARRGMTSGCTRAPRTTSRIWSSTTPTLAEPIPARMCRVACSTSCSARQTGARWR